LPINLSSRRGVSDRVFPPLWERVKTNYKTVHKLTLLFPLSSHIQVVQTDHKRIDKMMFYNGFNAQITRKGHYDELSPKR
jgi:hypothetical protein